MGDIDAGVAIGSVFALVLFGFGISGILNPRLQGGRDLNLIQSDEVSSGEQFGARVFGTLLIVMRLIVTYFVINSLFFV